MVDKSEEISVGRLVSAKFCLPGSGGRFSCSIWLSKEELQVAKKAAKKKTAKKAAKKKGKK